jgi:hypothetical protein
MINVSVSTVAIQLTDMARRAHLGSVRQGIHIDSFRSQETFFSGGQYNLGVVIFSPRIGRSVTNLTIGTQNALRNGGALIGVARDATPFQHFLVLRRIDRQGAFESSYDPLGRFGQKVRVRMRMRIGVEPNSPRLLPNRYRGL